VRIAIVYDALYPYVRGGAERRNHELSTRLRASHDVHVISWHYWDGPSVMVRDGITYHGVGRPPALYGADGKRRVSEVVSFSLRILPVLLRHRFDVIDSSATPYVPLYSAWLASRLTRRPLVVTWHEFWGDHWLDYLPQRPLVARLARAIESASRRLGDTLIAVSPFTAARLGQRADSRLRVIGNGIDLAAIRRAEQAVEPAEIAFVGRLIDEKRVDLLIDALALLRRRMPAVRCVIVGDGPQRDALEQRAGGLGVGDAVRFTGTLLDGEAYAQLKASRVFVLPSLREGFGVAVVEAQACGSVPIVVRSPMSAAPYLLRDGVDGRLCEPDPAAIADTLEELLTNDARRDQMSAAAERSASAHEWAAVAAHMEQAYVQAGKQRMAPVPAQ
jgi:glycosyltransferase involved in cell wall biosynthesis